MPRRWMCVLAMLSLLSAPRAAADQPPIGPAATPAQVAKVNASLTKSMTELRQSEWTETTVISLKGEEQSRTQASCSYRADGTVQRSAPATPVAADEPRVQEAIALAQQYVPPDPARIQAAGAAGRIAMTEPDAAGQVRMVIRDYLKPGDEFAIEVDPSQDRITGMTVATFAGQAKDPIDLRVRFGSFADETIYPAKIRVDIASMDMEIAIEDTGHKKTGH
jgi:hypothetical protein